MSTQETGDLIKSVNDMTATVAGKIGEIDKKVDEATKAVPQAIRDNFSYKKVYINLISGDDSSEHGPFKTIGAAINSVPDGGSVAVQLPYDTQGIVFEVNEAINVGSRAVTILGGYSGMENNGYKPTVLKMMRGYSSSLNRTYMAGRFYGGYGGRLSFNYIRVMLPRLVEGSSLEHASSGAVISGGISFQSHNYTISESMVFVEDDGTSQNPVYFIRSGARDNKGCIQDVTLSYSNLETAAGYALIDLQYGAATMRFAAHSSIYSDADGATVSWANAFNGLTYGTHGYSTNLLAPQSITKQPV